jgi:hypothetical protein
MTDKQTGGPAFPQSERVVAALSIANSQGMTLRDYFAAKAMQAFLTRIPMSGDEQARAAYKVADAMLSARGTVKAREA